MPEATKVQPWKSVWPAPDTTTDKERVEEGEKDQIPHFKLSGGRSAEFGYEEEVKVDEPKPEKK
ncbi:uncharacterized protein PV07_07800 [Cladophialophora immunda]|uniref:Uncharacterized protein n=1 Tax=Cladophialophora immunda TaxID=569365 RepID=A0A0D2CAN1_9EURO|nr:uncharacterized protein PV07_07800 [Cladophialophora immunda]KIW28118.1 hypothetical protein PV07_07800 [Cladophialophora immunda]